MLDDYSDYKLIRVEIRGFRKFREPWTLDLLSPAGKPLDYLVLAGPNGCGKTAVLEAILLALGREELIVRDLDAKERLTSPRAALEPQTLITAVFRDQRHGEDWQLQRRVDGISPWTWTNPMQRRALPWAIAKDKLSSLAVEYISSRRTPAHRIRQQQGHEPPDQKWMDKLNDFWRAFRDDGTHLVVSLVDPDDLSLTNPDDMGASDWDLLLYQGDRHICSVDALSSGEQEIIALIAPFIAEPFDGLLLFDEPELHLHPQWQGRVLRALRTALPDAQMIVATHANDPWDDAMSWERCLLVDADDPRHREPAAEPEPASPQSNLKRKQVAYRSRRCYINTGEEGL